MIAETARNAGTTRVFTLGIGSSVSHSLVNVRLCRMSVNAASSEDCPMIMRPCCCALQGIARAGNGEAEFVTRNDEVPSRFPFSIRRATVLSFGVLGADC